MKKVISLVVSIVMLACMLPIGVMAAAEADESLIFEMDLSEYTDSDKTVMNSVTNAGSTITVNGAPTLGTTAGGQKYLTFRRTTEAEPVSSTSVKVVDSDIAMADALTIEAWVRAEGYNLSGSKSGRIFGLGNSSNHFADFMVGPVKNVYYKANGQVTTNQTGADYQTLVSGNMNVYDETWVHYVITREWVAGENGAGTWKVAFYVNGDQKSNSAEYQVESRADESDKYLVIGAHKGGSAALWGDIGTFKVYNRILTQDEAIENYEESKVLFYPVPTGEKLIIDMDLSEYDDANKTVKNATIFGESAATVSGATMLGTTEGGQKYLTFGSVNESDERVNGDTSVKFDSTYLAAQDEMTFETWVRGTGFDTGGKSSRLFVLYDSASGTRVADLYNAGTTLGSWFRPGLEGQGEIKRGMAAYDEKWTHLAYTRKWTPDSEGSTTGKWTAEVYINGVIDNSWTSASVTRGAETNTSLFVGNVQNGTTQAFLGDIATFKVYNSILTGNSIKSKYEASYNSFYPTPQGEKLIIDMDLSEYDDVNKTVKNAAQYVDTTITVNGTPNLRTTEGGQKYLTFATAEKAAANNDDNRVYEAITFEEDYLKNQDAMTFEMWVRPTSLDYDARLFVMVNGSGTRVADLYVNSANNSFNYRPGSDEANGQITRTMTGQLGQWIHLAFTRKWTPDASGTTGTWDGELFVNGNQVQTTSIPNYTRKSETGAYFVLGNLQAKTRAFFGDIATFKVYNSVLTEDSIKAKYESSISGFVPAVTFSEFTTESTSVTATLASYLTEQLPSEYKVIMAVYDGGRLVDCSLGRTLNLDGLTLKTGMEIRCFIWDGLTDCTPLVEDCNTYCL